MQISRSKAHDFYDKDCLGETFAMMRGQSGTDSLKLTGRIDDKFANNSLAQLYSAEEQCEAE